MYRTDAVAGMVVALGAVVTPGLRDVARKWLLSILANGSARGAVKHVLDLQPTVIVVQVGEDWAKAMDFIRRAAGTCDRTVIIAAATKHATTLEQDALRAGARFYVDRADAQSLAPFLEALLGRGEPGRRQADTDGAD